MPGFFLALILATAVAAPALWLLRRRALAAEARAEGTAALSRRLHLLAREVEASGITLLTRATRPEAVAAEARRLLQLSDAAAEALAAGAGPRRISLAPVPLRPLLEEAIADFAALPGERHWRIDPGFAGMIIEADRRALLGALHQVLGRAARTTGGGAWIDLRPVLAAGTLAIVVEDEGAGPPAADLAGGAPEGTRGLGFGLSIARSLLEAHGGGLRLEALPGIGARAWLTLPRHLLVAAELTPPARPTICSTAASPAAG